jgi:hypothetical protein
MFAQILNEVTEQTKLKCQGSQHHGDYLIDAIPIWCNQLNISQDIADYIRSGYCEDEIQDLTTYIYQEGIAEKRDSNLFSKLIKTEKSLAQHINALFDRMNLTISNVKFIVLIAFGVTAIGYFVYQLNQQKQQQTTRREEPSQYKANPPSFTVSTLPSQGIANQFLVLVISASQADFLKSLNSKGRIDFNDGETLYKLTTYLWFGSESALNQSKANINRYFVLLGEESEYDINLIYLELKQSDEGFKKNINQLDRYDAFRKLSNLVVNFEISPRLRMEAYENIEVYNR